MASAFLGKCAPLQRWIYKSSAVTSLKYSKYIEKLKLPVQAVHTEIMVICTVYMFKQGIHDRKVVV